ncbi:MAG: cytochrome C [Candidatus Eisenbacteria bacterium]|nr:cytochrome C [Candidatus Eisenbacteria bacterium]
MSRLATTLIALTVLLPAAGGNPARAQAPSTAPAVAPAPAPPVPPPSDACVDCHSRNTPGAVADWKLSKHSAAGVGCAECHGDGHRINSDAAKALLPTPETCARCHAGRVEQFKHGKHAAAWTVMNAMPTIHWQPMAMIDGMKGCGGCHKIGIKSEAEARKLATEGRGFGMGSCDACHTRHTFSVQEARRPEACQTCHMGFDHPQWEMYSASKHGVRNALKQQGALPPSASAPTCQDCHMGDGNHEVRTAWGFLGVRLPLPADKQWAADQVTILQGLGVLDPAGKPTARLEAVKAADVARLDEESFRKERDKMMEACAKCHSRTFAAEQMSKGDDMIREADHLMAEGIRTVAALYKDGALAQPKTYAAAFPDLLTFHDAPTAIEQRLFVMFLEHRMRTFQGTFHASPDYALWYGWSEMRRDLTEIKEQAAQLRREHGGGRKAAAKR